MASRRMNLVLSILPLFNDAHTYLSSYRSGLSEPSPVFHSLFCPSLVRFLNSVAFRVFTQSTSCPLWVSFMPHERGRPRHASGSHSLVHSSTAHSLALLGCNCACHLQMEPHPAHSTSTDFEAKPTPTLPPSTTPIISIPVHAQASSSNPLPSSHPVFTEEQHNTIQALKHNNAEQKFRQELMEKRLDWLLDSGAVDPKKRHNEEELLQDIMVLKWPDSSEHPFPHNYVSK
jgi:hypothetical protein